MRRVENLAAWTCYVTKRDALVARSQAYAKARRKKLHRHGDGGRCEKIWLFHGCPPEAAPKIVAQVTYSYSYS